MQKNGKNEDIFNSKELHNDFHLHTFDRLKYEKYAKISIFTYENYIFYHNLSWKPLFFYK